MAISGQSRTSIDSSPTSEQIFEILSNRRRRFTLHHLLQQEDGTGELREVSRRVAAWENDIDADSVSYDQRRNVYTALKQAHLPTMETAGVVEYDERDGTIVLTQPAEQFDIYMDVVARGRTIPWSEFYLGIGTIFTALTVLHWTNLPPFRYVPALAWAGLIAAVIAVTGAVHLHYSRKMQLGAEGPPPELELRREYDE